MGHPDPMAEHDNTWLPCTLVSYTCPVKATAVSLCLRVLIFPLTPMLFFHLLLAIVYYSCFLTRIERVKKRGKYPEGEGGEEKKENKNITVRQ